MNNLTAILIWVAIIGVAFAYAWRKGHLMNLRDYVLETREELKKCTWPTWEELKGSTALVVVSIVLLGGFTVLVDFVCNLFVRWTT